MTCNDPHTQPSEDPQKNKNKYIYIYILRRHAVDKVGDKEVVRVRLYIKGVRMPTGVGFTTAHAEEDAAEKALAEWGGKVEHLKTIPHPMASPLPSPIYVEGGGGRGEKPFVITEVRNLTDNLTAFLISLLSVFFFQAFRVIVFLHIYFYCIY